MTNENIPVKFGFGCNYNSSVYPDVINNKNSSILLWSESLEQVVQDAASNVTMDYISLHFAALHLPETDYVLLKVNDEIVANLSEHKPNGIAHDPFFATKIPVQNSTIEVYRLPAAGNIGCMFSKCYGIVIDFFRSKANAVNVNGIAKPPIAGHESICGIDNSIEAKCGKDNPEDRPAYLASRAVARLLIHKEDFDAACTGWLFGCEGHIITNHHCISTDYHAANVEIEFMAEGDDCAQDCKNYGACRGNIEAYSARLIVANKSLDFALLQLEDAENIIKKYGYLHMREEPATKGESIYIPQHPLGWGKRLSLYTDRGMPLSIKTLEKEQCGIRGLSYGGDTQGGSSGSPVISFTDHSVVALHHCGASCSNTGVPATKIIDFLRTQDRLPNCAFTANSNAVEGNTENVLPMSDQDAVVGEMEVRELIAGAIQNVNGRVEIDRTAFTIEQSSKVIIDIKSVEISSDGEYFDINQDCGASYVDPAMFVFRKDSMEQVGYSDDSDDVLGKEDGSISFRDPYLELNLEKGSYIIMLGSIPFDRSDAIAGYSNTLNGASIFNCIDESNAGKYQITISSEQDVSIDEYPASQTPVLTTCAAINNATICSF